MTHQSGIQVSDALSAKFLSALNAPVRLIKVSIVGESLEATDTLNISGTFEQDMDLVPGVLDAETPCYLLIRLNEPKWLLCTYVPDGAKVREKMLYAATKATVTKSLGESNFVDGIFGTTKEEFSLEGYQQHRRHAESGAPLTERELEMERIKEMESSAVEVPTMESRKTHVVGATYDYDESAKTALNDYTKGTVNFVLLAIDTASEMVKLDTAENLQSHAEIAQAIPSDVPRFVFYWHDSTTSVFIYSCPASSSVRERMIYSSFRYGLLVTTSTMGIEVHAKLEIDDPTALSADVLEEEVRERVALGEKRMPTTQPKFKRPAPPGRRPRVAP
ncbi:Twinfilin-1 [Coemansia spiralis]|uniref:Twinfilin-1 n=2 Tax=Coemansia TaxID=4863 RepID=A0A9W8G6Y5_9FUNG|nr:Twinfilin-1 [Coemansia umbellata]KAJ2622535.1 Twinfilin-1 [Coemansia sp. RSA 1358]KAJ2677085.1 Twinfilin-1 [Coemansia spiralis]